MNLAIIYSPLKGIRNRIILLFLISPLWMAAQDNPCEVVRFYIPPFSVSKGTPNVEKYMLEDLTSFYIDKVKREALKNAKVGIYSSENDMVVPYHLELQKVFCEEYGICDTLLAPKSANTILIGLVHFFKASMKVQLELNVYSFEFRDIIGYGKSSKMELQKFFDEDNRQKMAEEAYNNCFTGKHMKDLLEQLPAPKGRCYIEPKWPLHLVPSWYPFAEGQNKEGYYLLATEAVSLGLTIFLADRYRRNRNKFLNATFLAEQKGYRKKMNTDKWLALGFGVGGYVLVTLADILIESPQSQDVNLSIQTSSGAVSVNLNFNF